MRYAVGWTDLCCNDSFSNTNGDCFVYWRFIWRQTKVLVICDKKTSRVWIRGHVRFFVLYNTMWCRQVTFGAEHSWHGSWFYKATDISMKPARLLVKALDYLDWSPGKPATICRQSVKASVRNVIMWIPIPRAYCQLCRQWSPLRTVFWVLLLEGTFEAACIYNNTICTHPWQCPGKEAASFCIFMYCGNFVQYMFYFYQD